MIFSYIKKIFSRRSRYYYAAADTLALQFESQSTIRFKVPGFETLIQMPEDDVDRFRRWSNISKAHSKCLRPPDIDHLFSRLKAFPLVIYKDDNVKRHEVWSLNDDHISEIMVKALRGYQDEIDTPLQCKINLSVPSCGLKIPDKTFLHPMEAYTLSRALRYKLQSAYKDTADLYVALNLSASQNVIEFKNTADHLIQQGFYVTKMCDTVLAFACQHDDRSSELIKHFRQSEKGHDALLKNSLKLLNGREPSKEKVLPETRSLMALLQYAAVQSPYMFAVAVEMFEGGIKSSGSEIIGKVLQKHEETKAAARGLLAHHHINEKAGHNAIGRTICEKISGTTIAIDEFKKGLNLLSALILMQAQMSRKLLKQIDRAEHSKDSIRINAPS